MLYYICSNTEIACYNRATKTNLLTKKTSNREKYKATRVTTELHSIQLHRLNVYNI